MIKKPYLYILYFIVQEISEGITKPVEKPIPKPLPPTVSLETDGQVQKRSIEEILKSQIRNSVSNNVANQTNSNAENPGDNNQTVLSSIPPCAASTPVKTTNASDSPSIVPTTSSANTSINTTTATSTSNESSYTHQNTYKRFKPNTGSNHHHHHHPRFSNSSHHHTSFYTSQHQHSNLMYGGHAQHSQQHYNQFNQQRYPSGVQLAGAMYPPNLIYHQAAAGGVNQSQMIPQMYAYQTTAAATATPYINQTGQVSYYTSATAGGPNGVYTGASYQTDHQQRQNAMFLQQNGYTQTRPVQLPIHHTNQQHHQQHQPLQINLNETNIKNEPIDQQGRGVEATQQDLAIKSSRPYFTNPMPFKQEPSDEAATTVEVKQEDTALNLVNHLLKDQSILSQLEKVAQTFKRN